MVLSASVSTQIIAVASTYIGRPFDYETFNCVHFVRSVYTAVGIELPLINRRMPPPPEFHLTKEEFLHMPIGHSVFFKRRESKLDRPWTHVALIASKTELVHCPRRFGGKVTVTSLPQFFEVYDLASKPQ